MKKQIVGDSRHLGLNSTYGQRNLFRTAVRCDVQNENRPLPQTFMSPCSESGAVSAGASPIPFVWLPPGSGFIPPGP